MQCSKASKVVRAWGLLTRQKHQERMALKRAYLSRRKLLVTTPLIQMLKVGLYWAQIKGRVHSSSSAFSKYSRTYLSMKYGYRWLNKVKLRKCKPDLNPAMLTALETPHNLTEHVS